MPSISERFRPASAIASSAALLMRSSEEEPSCLPNAVSPTPVMKLMACYFQLYVIPGRDEVASPESITTIGSMDSGPAPSGASRDDEVSIRLDLARLLAGLHETETLLDLAEHQREILALSRRETRQDDLLLAEQARDQLLV